MFGTKLRTWMEAHIVRPRRKQSRSAKESGTNTANSRQEKQNDEKQIQCADSNGPSVLAASNTDSSIHRDASGGSIAQVASQSGALGTGLSSPESAYSTGYSTDGTSPGAAPPPEYYINIRTGTHYFQRARDAGVQNALQNSGALKSTILKAPDAVPHSRHRRTESCCPQSFSGIQNSKISAHSSPVPPVKYLDAPTSAVSKQTPPLILGATTSPSPRQRSRIRTNPWMTGSSSRLSTIANSIGNGLPATNSSTCSSSITNFPAHETASHCLSASSSSCIAPSVSAGESAAENTSAVFSSSRALSSSKHFTPVANRRQSPRVSRQIRSPKKHLRASGSNSSKISIANVKRSAPICSSSTSTDEEITPKLRPTPIRSSQYLVNNLANRSRSDVDDEDEDVTLNEMMGKYDESYVYEKETDILSDSDPTDCEQDLMACGPGCDTDTGGEEAGDEDTAFDEMDYIDAEYGYSIHEDAHDNKFKNTGKCTYHGYHEFIAPTLVADAAARRRECYLRRSARRRSAKQLEQRARRSERSKRQRADFENSRQDMSIQSTDNGDNWRKGKKSILWMEEGSRSLGGTPLFLRRQTNSAASADQKRNYLARTAHIEIRAKKRSNSVSFAEGIRANLSFGRLSNCDSETAIMEADKEADQKYKELILEAENILVSMKSATPSPRHRPIPNIPTNKRVEHLRATEADLVFVKNRVENASIMNSPKPGKASPRFSPKKNHISNFINSNTPELSKRELVNDFAVKQFGSQNSLKIASPISLPVCPKSPAMVRKVYTNRLVTSETNSPVKANVKFFNDCMDRPKIEKCATNSSSIQSQMQSLRLDDDSDSCENDKKYDIKLESKSVLKKNILGKFGLESENGVRKNLESSSSDSDGKQYNEQLKIKNKPPLITFRSVDMGHSVQDTTYCPQSEPVKRKVYNCSVTYDRIQKSLEEPEEINLQLFDDENNSKDDTGKYHNNLRVKVAQLRRERLAAEAIAAGNNEPSSCLQLQISQMRRQILLHTLEGLKRNLQDQSASLKSNYCSPDNIKQKKVTDE